MVARASRLTDAHPSAVHFGLASDPPLPQILLLPLPGASTSSVRHPMARRYRCTCCGGACSGKAMAAQQLLVLPARTLNSRVSLQW